MLLFFSIQIHEIARAAYPGISPVTEDLFHRDHISLHSSNPAVAILQQQGLKKETLHSIDFDEQYNSRLSLYTHGHAINESVN